MRPAVIHDIKAGNIVKIMNSRVINYLTGTLEQESLIRKFVLGDTQSSQDSSHSH